MRWLASTENVFFCYFFWILFILMIMSSFMFISFRSNNLLLLWASKLATYKSNSFLRPSILLRREQICGYFFLIGAPCGGSSWWIYIVRLNEYLVDACLGGIAMTILEMLLWLHASISWRLFLFGLLGSCRRGLERRQSQERGLYLYFH